MDSVAFKTVWEAVGDSLKGDSSTVQAFKMECERHFRYYQFSSEMEQSLRGKSPKKDKEVLIRAAKKTRQVIASVEGLGRSRMEVLLERVNERFLDPQDPLRELFDPMAKLEELHEELDAYASLLEEAADVDLPLGHKKAQMEVVLAARIGHSGLRLGVFEALSCGLSSPFHKTTQAILSEAGYPGSDIRAICKAAREYLGS